MPAIIPISFEQFKSLKIGDTVFIKCGKGYFKSKVISEPFFNFGAAEPDWEVETTNGFCDFSSLYIAPTDFNINLKKANTQYWDSIDDIAHDCITAIAAMSTTPVELDCFDTMDIVKDIVMLVTNKLTENFGCEFPYIDSDY